MVKAVFLDRDGVIVVPEFREGRSYAPRRLEDLSIYPNACDSLSKLKRAGYTLIVVTNQPDVGNGLINRETVEAMHAQLAAQLPIDAIMTCYHTADAGCTCRKPNPGMLFQAASDFDIDLGRSVMIGDRASDIQAGISAGCRTVFIDFGYAEPRPESPTFVTDRLSSAVEWILMSSS